MEVKQRPIKVNATEEVRVVEKLDTYKRWFNGMKHFFTIKVLPSRRDT